MAETKERVTIVIDKALATKLHEMQGKAIGKTSKNVSFSDVINMSIQYAIGKGFNVGKLVTLKEESQR